jgi:hypothetical protein
MVDDNKVVDFNRRRAQRRDLQMTYLLGALDGQTLKTVFDAAFIEAHVDGDGDCIVDDDITLIVAAEPGKELLKLYAFFPTSGTREQVLDFCNRFNLHLVVVRAQVREAPNAEGQWTVIFDYDRLVFDEERIEAKSIVKTVRLFEAIVRNGISRYDEDGIF